VIGSTRGSDIGRDAYETRARARDVDAGLGARDRVVIEALEGDTAKAASDDAGAVVKSKIHPMLHS
jgi:hypothetical protein